jgi:hypothetical protein
MIPTNVVICTGRKAGRRRLPPFGVEPNQTVDLMPALDDDQERRGRLLLLGKGAVLAQSVARPLAAESDESR